MPSDPDLLETLASADDDLGRWIVALWTWLTPRLRRLDSRAENLHAIRERSLEDLATLPDLRAALVALRSSPDLLGEAARLLVALERWVAESGRPGTVLSEPAAGVDGELYHVTSWSNWLAETYWEHDDRGSGEPPDSDYPPSIHTLAPSLIVVPAVVEGIELEAVAPVEGTAAWRCLQRVRHRFEMVAGGSQAGAHEQPPRFVVHLATLGPNKLDGFKPDPARKVFVYADPDASGPTNGEIEASVAAAVKAASAAEASILLLPEFALPVARLSKLKELLAAADPAPTLTVAGMRHEDVELRGEPREDRAGKVLARWANEAIVLGDDGSELFRHRKLTAYAFEHEGVRLQEDARLGGRLPVLRSAIGNIAVMTCLDAFGDSVDRLRRSHASLVLVPSLSRSVSPHRVALAEAVRWLWGAAFVCNRDPTATGSEGWQADRVRSFWTSHC